MKPDKVHKKNKNVKKKHLTSKKYVVSYQRIEAGRLGEYQMDSNMEKMEKIVEQTLLYDFYGELLTSHQKMIYEEYVFDNFSISEIAKEHDISRQGVHDQLKRVDKLLNDYESTLHLIERFMKIKEKVNEISNYSKQVLVADDLEVAKKLVDKIDSISNAIIDEL